MRWWLQSDIGSQNIFDSLVACESAADAAGLDKTQCIQIDDENAPGTLCATPH